ncbi:MAG TPA: hypothetical protein VMR70_08590 [Flavisolibacter sp.]|nr:hypothetical protein [Flavisolibacter sp.]
MATLFDKIKYDGKRYDELQDPAGRREIEQLAAKLKPLEAEIGNDPKGTITIRKSGNVFSDSFERSLAAKITDIITGRE